METPTHHQKRLDKKEGLRLVFLAGIFGVWWLRSHFPVHMDRKPVTIQEIAKNRCRLILWCHWRFET